MIYTVRMPTLRDGLQLFRGRPPASNVAAITAGFVLSLLFLSGFVVLKVSVTGTHEAWAEKHMREEWFQVHGDGPGE